MDFNLNVINRKVTLYFTIAGFILSFISGLVAGNTFVNVFFRSIISGVVIGLVIIIANLLIAMFLPDLLEDMEESDDEDGHIDIVMPEEQYSVQSGETDNNDIDSSTEESSGTSRIESGFTEVGIENLQNLGHSSDIPEPNGSDDIINASSDSLGYSPSHITGGDPDIGNHSVEEMAKAVKSVLKKD